MGGAHAAVVALRVALADNDLDDPAGDTGRPWSELAATLHRVNSELRPAADYAEMGLVLPDLISDLHAVATGEPVHRHNALVGLLDVYAAAGFVAKHLGEPVSISATRASGWSTTGSGKSTWLLSAARWQGPRAGPRN